MRKNPTPGAPGGAQELDTGRSLRASNHEPILAHMSADEKTPTLRRALPGDGVARLVFVVLALNAVTAFAIQAWMTYGFASVVWVIPALLCIALIVALDLFAVMFMVLTYLLRGTGWPRGVATCVFVFAVGAQVYAAELYAEHVHWTPEVRIFAALPAVFLALAQEGVILWRTHRGRVSRRTRRLAAAADTHQDPAPTVRPAAAARSSVPRPARPTTPAVTPATPARTATPRPSAGVRRSSAGRPRDPRADDVIKRCLDADPPEKVKPVARELGVGLRSAQNWIKAERLARAQDVDARSVIDGTVAGMDMRPAEFHAGAPGLSDAPLPKENDQAGV